MPGLFPITKSKHKKMVTLKKEKQKFGDSRKEFNKYLFSLSKIN